MCIAVIMANIEERTLQSGKTRYRVKVRIKGHPPEQKTFERKTDAKRWANQTEAAIREGRYFKSREAQRHTLAEMVERYIRDVLPRKGSSIQQQKLVTSQLNWWKKNLGAYFLSDITPSMIAERRDDYLATPLPSSKMPSSSTSNRYLAALSHAYTVAQKEWGWIEDNPLRNVARLKEPPGRVRYLSDDERLRFLSACKEIDSPYLYPIAVLLLSTGARLSEICQLQWKDINIEQQAIILHKTKNGDRRTIPLQGHALDLIKKHSKVRRLDSFYVFPNRVGKKGINIRTAFNTAIANANIHDFKIHDLRHSAASYLAMNGATLNKIAAILGHKTLQMVMRYAHLSPQHTSKVVESMNSKIFS